MTRSCLTRSHVAFSVSLIGEVKKSEHPHQFGVNPIKEEKVTAMISKDKMTNLIQQINHKQMDNSPSASVFARSAKRCDERVGKSKQNPGVLVTITSRENSLVLLFCILKLCL